MFSPNHRLALLSLSESMFVSLNVFAWLSGSAFVRSLSECGLCILLKKILFIQA